MSTTPHDATDAGPTNDQLADGESRDGAVNAGAPMTFSPTCTARMGQFDTTADSPERGPSE